MTTIDFSYETSLLQQYKKVPGRKITTSDIRTLPEWMEWIQDLVEGAGYSCSRIAYRIKVSPSTIHKFAGWQIWTRFSAGKARSTRMY